MLTDGKRLLGVANERFFAVPAFNVSDHAMMQGLFEVAEVLRSPLIIAIHPDELAHVGATMLPAVIERAHRSPVPVAIHLDHGETYDQLVLSIQAGFTSAMIDASMRPWEENVALTRRVVRTASVAGLSVEAELGTIGQLDEQAEHSGGSDHAGGSGPEIIYTDPEDAARFVAETGVDSLAVAIGTSHGLYPAHVKPEIRLDLLMEIKTRVAIPLVLHGGSGNPDEEVGEAVRLGINKVNISSDIKDAYHRAMREVLSDPALREPNVIQPPCVDVMKDVAAQKIELFRSVGKAGLY